jgi:hypothetical protein
MSLHSINPNLQIHFDAVIEASYNVSRDVGEEVEAAFTEGDLSPLGEEELRALLKTILSVMADRASERGVPLDLSGGVESAVETIIVQSRRSRTNRVSSVVSLRARNRIEPHPVFPVPMFHGKEVPMLAGWVRTSEIKLWENNERLEIHVAQFEQRNGRRPDPRELLDLMMSRVVLPGISAEDQFEIVSLARSIATNGVQKPPIIAVDGTLLDGNRRVTACHLILNSDEFSTDQKKRAEWLFVWQLTEHATDEDRERVVVALNFEEDYKEPWPEYIKARKVVQEWEAMLTLESPPPNQRRQSDMKKELSMRFALGPTTGVVNRYLKMMDWADKFENYHIGECGRDTYEVQHRSSEAFQYFDELSKGQSEGGVANVLSVDDTLRHAVFDLLFRDLFKNWRQIRDLKYAALDEDARDALIRARNEPDEELAEDLVENAIAGARTRRAEERKVGANTRIESFVKWLLDVPVGSFSDGTIKPKNLRLLLTALNKVEDVVKTALESGDDYVE